MAHPRLTMWEHCGERSVFWLRFNGHGRRRRRLADIVVIRWYPPPHTHTRTNRRRCSAHRNRPFHTYSCPVCVEKCVLSSLSHIYAMSWNVFRCIRQRENGLFFFSKSRNLAGGGRSRFRVFTTSKKKKKSTHTPTDFRSFADGENALTINSGPD